MIGVVRWFRGRACPGRINLPTQPFSVIDHLLCWVVVSLVGFWTYHPYFFGDEITVMRETSAANGFVDALLALSAYKPRLIFNSLWAWGAVAELPRSVFAIVNTASIAAVCSLTVFIAGRWFGAGRGQAWLLVGVILSSRFAAMLYFDYLCGIIDTLSLALLLATVVMTVSFLRDRRRAALIVPAMLATATVLVHERYVAATFALACVIAVWIWRRRSHDGRAAEIFFAAGIALLPPMVFVGLTSLLRARSLSTGTAGEEIALGVGTLKVVATYSANVMLGTNFGKDWFVGAYNVGSPAGTAWSLAFAILFALLWGVFAWSLRRRPDRIQASLGLLAVVGALVVIASLPGEARQEARWMYPAAVLAALLVFCSPLIWLRWLILSAMLSVSLVHWAGGALDSIYNIHASRTARNLAQSVHGLLPAGRNAVVMGMQTDTWTLGNDEGLDQFSRRNLGGKINLRRYQPDAAKKDWADMAFLRVGDRFAVVDGLPLDVLTTPERVEWERGRYVGCAILGSGEHWDGWSWTSVPQIRGDGVTLTAATRLDGHRLLPATELDAKDLFYRAHTPDAVRTAAMRLQVNWLDGQGEFISTQIQVVEVGSETELFRMPLSAPAGAVTAAVYATLHDGEPGPVMLEEISTASPAVLELGGGDWQQWQWTTQPRKIGTSVVLESAAITVGTLDASAALLDRRILVYRAKSLRPGTASTIRLQINWSDASGRFIGAQIETAQVDEELGNATMLVTAPDGASRGVVYANLHDGSTEPVELQSVSLLVPHERPRPIEHAGAVASKCPLPVVPPVVHPVVP